MKRMIAVALTLVLFGLPSKALAEVDGSPDMDALLSEIRKTLIKINNDLEEETLPTLKSVKFLLKTAIRKKTGGGITLFVVQLGASYTHQTVQTIEVTLVPPKAAQPIAAGEFSDAFARAIMSVAKTIDKTKGQDPPLVLKDLKASINFATDFSGKADGKVVLLPVTIDLGGSVSESNTHTAILTFSDD